MTPDEPRRVPEGWAVSVVALIALGVIMTAVVYGASQLVTWAAGR